MKAMKFRVKNEAHSKAIQQRLFDLGYKCSAFPTIQNDDFKRFIYTNEKGFTCFGVTEGAFNQHPNTETTLEDLYKEEVSDTVTDEVIQDIKARREAGLKKYGTTLDRTDLTQKEWIQHAYEEALDLACYLKKIMQ